MSKETKIIISLIIFIFVFFGSLFGYFIIAGTGKTISEITFSDIKQYFGFKGTTATSIDKTAENNDLFGSAKTSTNTAFKEDITTSTATKNIEPVKIEVKKEIKKEVIPTLRQISSSPIAGAISIKKETGDVIKYIEKSTGHIFETSTSTLQVKKISNTTIFKINEALWINEISLIIRYLDRDEETIKSFYTQLRDKKGNVLEKELVISALPDDIKEITVLKDNIFYLTGDGGSIGIVSKTNNEKKEEVWEYPLKQWLIQWPKEDILTLTTKPSSSIDGYLFFLNKRTKAFDKIISKIKGLTTLASPDATQVLYSNSVNNDISLYTYNISKKEIKNMPIKTLPEKCVWSKDNLYIYCGFPRYIPKGDYPDIWYRGEFSFSDDIVRIDTTTATAKIISSPKTSINTEIDLIKPFLSADEDYLMFIDKKNSSFWSLKLK